MTASATGSPILVPFEVLFVRRIKARQLSSVRDFIHDPGLRTLLFRSDAGNIIHERGWDQHRAVVVHDNHIVGIDAHAATADRLLPIDKGKAGHRGGSRRARTPNGEAGLENACHVAHGPVRNKSSHARAALSVRTTW